MDKKWTFSKKKPNVLFFAKSTHQKIIETNKQQLQMLSRLILERTFFEPSVVLCSVPVLYIFCDIKLAVDKIILHNFTF